MAPVSPSTAVERRFYTIVRWFGLIATSVALAIAGVSAAGGLFKLFPNAGASIQAPKTTYDDFRRTTEARRAENTGRDADTTLREKEAAATNAAAEADFERRLKPHLDAILANLTIYSEKVGQAKPSAQAVGDYIRSNMRQAGRSAQDDATAWGYVEGLEQATRDLSADADRLAKLDSADPARVRWDVFLDWYTGQYNQQINAELQRIRADRVRAAAEAAAAPGLFYAGAVAFGFFVVGTLLLLLLRIELNTRQS